MRLLAVAGASIALAAAAAAETRRPADAALVAGAKRTPLDRFNVRNELRGKTVEPWLKELFGGRTIAWRATSCRAEADGRVMIASPLCVEATVRFDRGVAFALGIGFDDKAARPEDHPNALWGTITVRGEHCDFIRHPDHMVDLDKGIDEMVRAGGRCM